MSEDKPIEKKELSNEAVQLLSALFHTQSQVQFPVGAARAVLNVQDFLESEVLIRGIEPVKVVETKA